MMRLPNLIFYWQKLYHFRGIPLQAGLMPEFKHQESPKPVAVVAAAGLVLRPDTAQVVFPEVAPAEGFG